MGIKLRVKMTTKDMYDFMLYHAYTGVLGILSVVISVIVLLVGYRIYSTGDTFSAYAMFFFGGSMLIFLPIALFFTSHSQVANSRRFQTPIDYAFTGKGIEIKQGDKQIERPWDDITKAVATRKSVFLYTSRVSAIILPKSAIGQRYADLVEMLYKNMPNERVKIKNVG